MTFHEQLQKARKAAGLSQEQLANLMNMSRQGVSHWENGRTLPDVETLKKLSEILNCNFFDDIGPEKEEALPEAPSEESVSAEAAPEKEKKRARGVRSAAKYALCAAIGFVLGCFFMYACFSPSGDGLTLMKIPKNYKSSDALQAELSVYTDESPVLLRYLSEDDENATWLYNIVIEETAGVSFQVEEVVVTFIDDLGDEGQTHAYTPQQLLFGDGILVGYGKFSFGGGLPVQPLSGIRASVRGVDGKGNRMEHIQFLPFSKQLAE